MRLRFESVQMDGDGAVGALKGEQRISIEGASDAVFGGRNEKEDEDEDEGRAGVDVQAETTAEMGKRRDTKDAKRTSKESQVEKGREIYEINEGTEAAQMRTTQDLEGEREETGTSQVDGSREGFEVSYMKTTQDIEKSRETEETGGVIDKLQTESNNEKDRRGAAIQTTEGPPAILHEDGDIEASQSSPPVNESQAPHPWMGLPRWRKIVVFIGLFLGLFLATLDTSIVATSLVTIVTELNDFALSPWVVLAYLVAYMSFAIVFARLSDIYGRKNAILGAWVIFTTFSIACAVSKSMIQIIVFRGLQGIGGSGLFSLAMILIPEATSPEKIGLISGLIGIVLGCSGVLGPILGGLISHLTTWRWIFYLNVPIAGVAITTILIAWPQSHSSVFSVSAFLSIDFLGIFLVVAANCLHIYGFETAGSMGEEWSSSSIVGVLLTSACCWISFVAWELYLASRPVTPTSLRPLFPFKIVLHNRVMAAVMLSTFLTGFPFITVSITLPERFQLVNAASPLSAGLHLLPLLAASAFGSFLGGALAKIPSKSKPSPPSPSLPAPPSPTPNLSSISTTDINSAAVVSGPLPSSSPTSTLRSSHNMTPYNLLASSVLQLLGTALLSTLPRTPTTSIPHQTYIYETLLGVGIGISLSTTSILGTIHSTPSTLASTQGAIAQVRFLGGIVGLTISTTLFSRRSSAALKGLLTPAQLRLVQKSPLAALGMGEVVLGEVRGVYGNVFGQVMRVLVYVCAIGVVVAAGTWEKREKRIGVGEGFRRHGGGEGEEGEGEGEGDRIDGREERQEREDVRRGENGV